MESRITTIIFDLGRVLAGYDWKDYLNSVTSDPEAYRAVEWAMFLNPVWVEHDKGLVDDETELQDFIAAAPAYEAEIRKTYENLGACIQKWDYAFPWVRELKEKGYRVYALSNWQRHIFEQCEKEQLDFLELMDGAFLSFREHLIKPDERAFLRLMEMFDIRPGEAVFLDDTACNVEAAERLGFHGILFRNQEQAREELRKLGVA